MAFGWFSTLLDEVASTQGSAAGNYLSSKSGLSALIRSGEAAGQSGRQVLEAFRGAGGTVTNSTYWQLRRDVLDAGQPVSDAGALLRGDSSAIRKIPGGRAGLFQIDFKVYVQRAAGGALPENSTTTFSMVQRELDIEGALEAMAQVAADVSNAEGESGRWLSFEILNIGQYTG